jgi:uncharacterized membrane protein required for colicin V production
MALTCYDCLIFLPLAIILVFETRQEFGRSLTDAFAALAALYLASAWVAPAAPVLRFSVSPDANYGITFLVLFALLLMFGLIGSRYLNATVFQVSMDALDPLFGAVFGLALAIIVGHAVTYGMTAYYGVVTPDFLANSPLADELLNLRWVHSAAGSVQHFVRS